MGEQVDEVLELTWSNGRKTFHSHTGDLNAYVTVFQKTNPKGPVPLGKSKRVVVDETVTAQLAVKNHVWR